MLPRFFQRSSRWLLIAFAAVMPAVVWGAWHAYDRRDNSVLGWLPERSPVTRAYRHFLDIFGPDETVLVSWEGCTLDAPALERLAAAVEARAATAPAWYAAVTTGTRLRDDVMAAADVDEATATSRLRGTLIGADEQTTCLVVTLHPLDDVGRSAAVEWLVAAAEQAGAEGVRLTGDAVVSVAIDRENERTAGLWSNVAMLIALVLACATLRSLRLGLMVIAIAGFSSLAVEAAIFFSGASMNMLVSLVPVVTFVLTISATVHLMGYWVEALPEHGPADAPGVAVAHGWLPSMIAGLTTMLGMASLCVSQVRPVWQFGLYGAIGTVIAFAAVFAGLPALLQTFPPRPGWTAADATWPGVKRFVRWLIRQRRVTTAVSLTAMLLLGLGLLRLETEVRPVRFLPQASRWVADLDWFNERIGPFQTVEVVMAFPAGSGNARAASPADRAALVQDVAARLRAATTARGSLSAATFLPDAIVGDTDRGRVRSVIRRGVIDGMLRRHRPGLVDAGMVADDGAREWWRISLQVAGFTATEERQLRSELGPLVAAAATELSVAAPLETVLTGGVPLVISAQAELLDSLVESSITAFLTIGGVLALFFRNLFVGLLALVPNVFPLAIVFGAMGWAGWPLDVGGMMTASIALGIAVDDTVHLLSWYHRLGAEGVAGLDRVEGAVDRVAMPMIRSALVLGLAFAVFALCGFKPIAQFGILLATLLGVALVGDLVQTPAILAGPVGRLLHGNAGADPQQRVV